jgi:hypothetical protein
MNSKLDEFDSEEDRLRHLLRVMGDHAVQFKAHFHEMQEKFFEASTRAAKLDATVKRQRAYIEELEHELGRDNAL